MLDLDEPRTDGEHDHELERPHEKTMCVLCLGMAIFCCVVILAFQLDDDNFRLHLFGSLLSLQNKEQDSLTMTNPVDRDTQQQAVLNMKGLPTLVPNKTQPSTKLPPTTTLAPSTLTSSTLAPSTRQSSNSPTVTGMQPSVAKPPKQYFNAYRLSNLSTHNISETLRQLERNSSGYWIHNSIDMPRGLELNQTMSDDHEDRDTYASFFAYSEVHVINDEHGQLPSTSDNQTAESAPFMKWISNRTDIEQSTAWTSLKQTVVDCLWNKRITTWGDSTMAGIDIVMKEVIVPSFNQVYPDVEKIQLSESREEFDVDGIGKESTTIIHGSSAFDGNRSFTIQPLPHFPSHHFGQLLFNAEAVQLMRDYARHNTTAKCSHVKEKLMKQIFCDQSVPSATHILDSIKSRTAQYIRNSDVIVLNSLVHDSTFWAQHVLNLFPDPAALEVLRKVFNISMEEVYPMEMVKQIEWIKSVNDKARIIYWSGIAPFFPREKTSLFGIMPDWWFTMNAAMLRGLLLHPSITSHDVRFVDTRNLYKNVADEMLPEFLHYHVRNNPTYPWVGIEVIKAVFSEICNLDARWTESAGAK